MHLGQEQQEAFVTLQRVCTESPLLAYANFKTSFILYTHANGEELGVVFYHVKEGRKKVIVYASRCLSKGKKKYPAHKMEF